MSHTEQALNRALVVGINLALGINHETDGLNEAGRYFQKMFLEDHKNTRQKMSAE